jgi:hypothetical protein
MHGTEARLTSTEFRRNLDKFWAITMFRASFATEQRFASGR